MHVVQSPEAARALRALRRRPAKVDTLAPAAIAAGATTREVAEILEIDPRTVARRWGCQPARGPRSRHDVTDVQVLDLRRQQLSLAEIAAVLSEQTVVPVSRGLVRTRLARYGLAANTRHPEASHRNR